MRAAEPGLNVDSVAKAIAWYARVAGFSPRFVVPGADPPYALIARDGLVLHLRKRPEAAGTSFCYLVVPDADAWFARLKAQGASFTREIEDSDYGMRDFDLRDCCGNSLQIGTELPR